MTELDQVIARAFASEGKQQDVNQVYLAFLRATLFIPIKKDQAEEDEEPFRPLFAKVEDHYFLLAFDTLERLTEWAGEQFSSMSYEEISGRDLIAGLGEQVFLGLNLGSEYYKEFGQDEIKHLKKIVSRLSA